MAFLNPHAVPTMSRALGLILFLMLTCLLRPCAEASEVRSLRISTGKDYTRAMIELSGPADYKVFTLTGPDRLVIDVKGGKLRRSVDGDGRGLVRSVRSGRPEPNRLRIVFDLHGPVDPKSYVLDPGERSRQRLVVDMMAARDFAQAAAPPIAAVAASAASTSIPAPAKAAAQAPGGGRKVVVAIDAGHGGKDPGAIGPGGTREKDITLTVAKLLAARIDAEPGMKAVLIRDRDDYIALRSRFEKAREHKADLFISIHADAAPNRSAIGSSVYMLSTRGASNEASRYLAERENRADLVGGVSLSDKDQVLAAVLLDLSQGATLEASAQAAEFLLSSLTRTGKAHKRHVERANFAVLRSPDVPSVLVETGFISNPEEEKKLADPGHRGRLADALLSGVRDYFHAAPPPGTWIAANTKVRSHVVARGETLSEIAQRHRVSVAQIRQVNALQSDRVKAGEVLRIPTSS